MFEKEKGIIFHCKKMAESEQKKILRLLKNVDHKLEKAMESKDEMVNMLQAKIDDLDERIDCKLKAAILTLSEDNQTGMKELKCILENKKGNEPNVGVKREMTRQKKKLVIDLLDSSSSDSSDTLLFTPTKKIKKASNRKVFHDDDDEQEDEWDSNSEEPWPKKPEMNSIFGMSVQKKSYEITPLKTSKLRDV